MLENQKRYKSTIISHFYFSASTTTSNTATTIRVDSSTSFASYRVGDTVRVNVRADNVSKFDRYFVDYLIIVSLKDR